MIPLVDLEWQRHVIDDEVKQRWASIVERSSFILGDAVREFEDEYADYCGVRHCVGVGNGTDALELALRAVGIGQGARVVVPANTFVATAFAVLACGATPVFVDCDPVNYLMDLASLEQAASAGVDAVVPVHLFGQLAPIQQIRAVVPDVPVIEDAAQSQGARSGANVSGSLGAIAGTSFYPGKNLGAFGDGGAVTTDDDDLAAFVREVRNLGSVEKYEHRRYGRNSRLDSIQAAVLSAKLKHLDDWNALRSDAAKAYDELLRPLGIKLPQPIGFESHVWHLYVVEVPSRDEVARFLGDEGVGSGIHYPVPVHLQPAFEQFELPAGSFPVAESAARSMLSLPLYPGITQAQQEQVATALERALTRVAG